ncbi:hypothetical protein LXL04_027502 [Taraxacum kok-saghyz]
MDFQASVSQNTIPSEIPSSDHVPIGVSSHSQESLPTQESDENRRLQAKIARANRKIALQMSAVRNTNQSTTSSSRTSRKTSKKRSLERNKDEDHNIYYTPDNMKLKVVVQKLLTSSDVGDQGRILLPKKEVEENLPGLATKEGVLIVMKEVFSYTEWRMKFRYWANHKGNIYLFDQCDDFIQKNLLEAGDQLNLYQDEQKNLYFNIKKQEIHTKEACDNYISERTEEEDYSLRILMEELKHKDEEEPITLTSLYNTCGS